MITMSMLTNDQKAKIYDKLIYQYQKLQEEIRQIKAKNFEVSEKDQKRINMR
jgi:glutamate mutase epsilon subunit